MRKTEFGTTDDDYSLTKQQLDQIPDVLDGHQLSKNDKYTLVLAYWKSRNTANLMNY